MKVVIDCNALVSAARSGGVCGTVIVEAVRRHEIVLSAPIVDEYKTIAERLGQAPYREGLLAIIGELEIDTNSYDEVRTIAIGKSRGSYL